MMKNLRCDVIADSFHSAQFSSKENSHSSVPYRRMDFASHCCRRWHTLSTLPMLTDPKYLFPFEFWIYFLMQKSNNEKEEIANFRLFSLCVAPRLQSLWLDQLMKSFESISFAHNISISFSPTISIERNLYVFLRFDCECVRRRVPK